MVMASRQYPVGFGPGQQRLISYFFWIRPEQSLALFTPEIRNQLQRKRLCESLQNSLLHNTSAVDPLNKMLYLEQKYFLVDHNFNYTDKTSMASGVEVRVPFLDPDLVSFANSLPTNLKYRGRHGKWILKQSLSGILPDAVLKRKKTGFGAENVGRRCVIGIFCTTPRHIRLQSHLGARESR
jgi:asparagine synthase (glutamine-hydrolysing)